MMYPPWIRLWPPLRVAHRLAPFWVPGTPGINDVREWRANILHPAGSNTPVPILGNPLTLRASLHRILVEAGIAGTPANNTSDPSSWFALLRYGQFFSRNSSRLEFKPDFLSLDFRLRGLAADEIANGICYYILREHYGLKHISNVAPLIAATNPNPELRRIPGSKCRFQPDLFCEDSSTGQTVIAEGKACADPTGSLERPIRKGLLQVHNVEPILKPLRPNCARLVFGTHFRVEDQATPIHTETCIYDPPAPASLSSDPKSDQVIRHSYAKCFRFMGLDALADALLLRSPLREIEKPDVERAGPIEFYPLLIGPDGKVYGLSGPVLDAIWKYNDANMFAPIADAVATLADSRSTTTDFQGYVLGNGIVVAVSDDLRF